MTFSTSARRGSHPGVRYLLIAGALMLALGLAACSKAPEPAEPSAPSEPSAPAQPTWSGPVIFGEMDWDSPNILNGVVRFIFENGYDQETDTVPGSNIPIMQALARGDAHVHMEIGYASVKDAWDEVMKTGKVVEAGISFPDTIQGFFVPRYMIEGDAARGIEPITPDLKSVYDLPQYWELFKDAEVPDKGRIYGCVPGWACEAINEQKVASYGLDETYNLYNPGSAGALASSLVGAHKKGEPWLGYYWAPTAIMGKYPMIMLEEPPYTDECWDTTRECAYPVVENYIGVSKELADGAPRLMEFFDKFGVTQQEISEMLAYMEDNNAQAEEAAMHFLRTREDLWTEWVSDDVADKVRKAL